MQVSDNRDFRNIATNTYLPNSFLKRNEPIGKLLDTPCGIT
jgi:hypothetical protein